MTLIYIIYIWSNNNNKPYSQKLKHAFSYDSGNRTFCSALKTGNDNYEKNLKLLSYAKYAQIKKKIQEVFI